VCIGHFTITQDDHGKCNTVCRGQLDLNWTLHIEDIYKDMGCQEDQITEASAWRHTSLGLRGCYMCLCFADISDDIIPGYQIYIWIVQEHVRSACVLWCR
jgi:hypothetical protein